MNEQISKNGMWHSAFDHFKDTLVRLFSGGLFLTFLIVLTVNAGGGLASRILLFVDDSTNIWTFVLSCVPLLFTVITVIGGWILFASAKSGKPDALTHTGALKAMPAFDLVIESAGGVLLILADVCMFLLSDTLKEVIVKVCDTAKEQFSDETVLEAVDKLKDNLDSFDLVFKLAVTGGVVIVLALIVILIIRDVKILMALNRINESVTNSTMYHTVPVLHGKFVGVISFIMAAFTLPSSIALIGSTIPDIVEFVTLLCEGVALILVGLLFIRPLPEIEECLEEQNAENDWCYDENEIKAEPEEEQETDDEKEPSTDVENAEVAEDAENAENAEDAGDAEETDESEDTPVEETEEPAEEAATEENAAEESAESTGESAEAPTEPTEEVTEEPAKEAAPAETVSPAEENKAEEEIDPEKAEALSLLEKISAVMMSPEEDDEEEDDEPAKKLPPYSERDPEAPVSHRISNAPGALRTHRRGAGKESSRMFRK